MTRHYNPPDPDTRGRMVTHYVGDDCPGGHRGEQVPSGAEQGEIMGYCVWHQQYYWGFCVYCGPPPAPTYYSASTNAEPPAQEAGKPCNLCGEGTGEFLQACLTWDALQAERQGERR